MKTREPERPVDPAKIFPVSWDQFHRDSRALAWRLSGAGPFEAIVCITRGGLVPAAIVARELGIKLIETVCVSSYTGTSQGDLTVLKNVADSIVALGGGQGVRVLLVDDLVDTGKTAKVVREIVPRAHLATVYAKPDAARLTFTITTSGVNKPREENDKEVKKIKESLAAVGDRNLEVHVTPLALNTVVAGGGGVDRSDELLASFN